MIMEPFALHVYKRYLAGEDVERLSAELGIPADRIVQRIKAAEAYCERIAKKAA